MDGSLGSRAPADDLSDLPEARELVCHRAQGRLVRVGPPGVRSPVKPATNLTRYPFPTPRSEVDRQAPTATPDLGEI